jgi:hypothetical protein
MAQVLLQQLVQQERMHGPGAAARLLLLVPPALL